MGEDRTIEYYNQNAENFAVNTWNADMHAAQTEFLSLIADHGKILDFGCGSGRDTRFFLDQGYDVTAIDGSAELCRLASSLTGVEVKNMLFQELDEVNVYDGIWACSSILHLPKEELLPVLHKMGTALKNKGVIYTSFKYGSYEGERKGRYFTDFKEDTFRDFLTDVPELTIDKYWITGDVRPERGNEKWLNLILRKR